MSFWAVKKWAEAVENGEALPSPVVHKVQSKWWSKFLPQKVLSPAKHHTTLDAEPSIKNSLGVTGTKKENGGDDLVDVIVVDRSWTASESEASVHEDPKSATDAASVRESQTSGPLPALRRRILVFLRDFFNPRFEDPAVEAAYQKETWSHSKRLALFASIFFISNWVLGVIFVPQPLVLSDKIYYYGVAPMLCLPLVPLIAFDFPRDRPVFYQLFLAVATWSWSFYQVLFLFLCNYYHASEVQLFTCGNKDFLSTFYYTTALQTVALFGTNLRRLSGVSGAVGFLLFSSTLINRASWTRNIINFLAFQIFLLYMHYQREISARRLYDLHNKLEHQFSRTKKAQVNERNAADSKHRLTSRMLRSSTCSQVRVPLNTALLAVQNIAASGTMSKSLEVEFKALESSLTLMSKVLNDILDFNRMDTGRFESLARPYSFHSAMRSLLLPLGLATKARDLELVTKLDTKIDDIARSAALHAQGESQESIKRILKEQPSNEDNMGMVVGDETRLMQLVFNLASNACKFTPSGGRLTISTRLVLPQSPPSASDSDLISNLRQEEMKDNHSLSEENVLVHNSAQEWPADKIIVRVEVTDTGLGIRPTDMDQTKLFSAFNQTEQGRRQGGKGTGLGLALVRLIVKLSHGRLGVKSKVGQGSTFWVELPLGVGAKALEPCEEAHPSGLPEREKFNVVDLVDDQAKQIPPSSARVSAIKTGSGLHRSMSALQSLMDQGGLVELSLNTNGSRSSVPTRTVHDLHDNLPGSDDEDGHPSWKSDPPLPTPLESPGSSQTPDSSTTVRNRPNYINLPQRASFTFDPSDSPTSQAQSSPLSRSALFDSVEALVVDDDPWTRTLMKRMLERLGVSVTLAENGEIALSYLLGDTPPNKTPSSDISVPILSQFPPDKLPPPNFAVVFLDNQMPVLTGLQTVAKLRELGRRDFVVGLTANALISDQTEYLEAGVDHVLTKPVLERSLRQMLQLAEERLRQATPSDTPCSGSPQNGTDL